jgi:two-component system, sensor histidine kinase and response regulator
LKVGPDAVEAQRVAEEANRRLKTLFEPFGQAPLADMEGTTALGLSISRGMARLMGGDLTVRSEVGVGSEFVVFLAIAAGGDVPR